MGKGPGKNFRNGISLIELFDRFPDDAAAEKYFTETRWPNGPRCPYCGSANVKTKCKHPTMPYRCREKHCNYKRFSVRTGTIMEASNLGYRIWALATYLVMTNLKSVSSMKLHRDLKICQKTAWFLVHRIREAWKEDNLPFSGPVEADETYMGGLRKNMSNKKRKLLANTGRGPVGKTAIVGVKDRATNKISADVVERTDAYTLQTFVEDHVRHDAKVYTDEYGAYRNMHYFEHDTVRHSVREYVKKGGVHTNGIESFWSMLQRAHTGTFHKISPKHMHRYVTEFTGRHNARSMDTEDQMKKLVRGMQGRRLKYPDLVR